MLIIKAKIDKVNKKSKYDSHIEVDTSALAWLIWWIIKLVIRILPINKI